MQAHLVGWTAFDAALMKGLTGGWETDAQGGQALAEACGRGCYESWSKPNPATATNAGYLRHILDVGHLSVLEHGTVTLYLTGVSRSFTHELVRHRHFSYSQLSQRYVDMLKYGMVTPEVIEFDTLASEALDQAYKQGKESYAVIVDELMEAGRSRKEARGAARAALPEAMETKIFVTGNYRAWRKFVALRATIHADAEIRNAAVVILNRLMLHAPNVFGDFVITTLPDGSQAAQSQISEPA